jgi:heat shock protein HtpX
VVGRLAAGANLAKTWILLLGIAGLLGGLGWLLGGHRLLWIFGFCGLLAGAAVYWYADRVVLGIVGAKELPAAEAPALVSTAERLAARAGVPRPRLYIVRDGHPGALSAGRGGRGHALVVSTGLLAALPPAELEGVVAHELAHAARRDVLVQSVATVISSTLLELSRVGGWLQRALLFVLGPIASAIVHLLLSPKREFAADRLAAMLCDSPHGLADALIRLEQANELVAFTGNPALAPLYTVNPFEERGLAGLFAASPRTAERIARLRSLDPNWRDRLRAA